VTARAGRRRGLDQLATPRGAFALALLRGLDRERRGPLCEALAPHLSGVVLDVASAAAAIDAGQLPGRCGLAIDLGDPGPEPRLAPGCSPATIRRLGASAGYLRLRLRPEGAALHARAQRVARLAATLCHAEGLPLVLHATLAGAAAPDAHEELTASVMRALVVVPADLMIVPLAIGTSLQRPWIVELEAARGEGASTVLTEALQGGAQGFAAGRGLDEGPADRGWLLDVAAPRAAALREIVEERLVSAA
jgi:tagatose-1,6-bisphosphate aldolase